MGKSEYYTAKGGRRAPTVCLGCHKPIVFGERCPPCAHEVKVKAVKGRAIKRKRR
jgi:hypothetical protein